MLAGMLARVLALLLLLLAVSAHSALAQEQGARARMVVELFTSQGCSQCPRANRLLGMFSHEDDVLALTFPVGIWDYLGWRDTFAQPDFSERQRSYSGALRVRGRFTPQLVVNGARQISASDWDQARAIYDAQYAEGWPSTAPDLSLTRLPNNRVRVTVGASSDTRGADVWLVTYEPGPVTVVIRGGVNINRSVAHYNLVTRIERLGEWNGTPVWYERRRCAPQCAVLVQHREGGPIIAAAYTGRARR